MLKKTVAAGVDIDAMKRNVNSLVDCNANIFNLLAEDYTKLSRGPVPEDLFSTFTVEEFFGNEEIFIKNKDVDLFGNLNEEEEAVNFFGEKIVKDEKQSMYENYV